MRLAPSQAVPGSLAQATDAKAQTVNAARKAAASTAVRPGRGTGRARAVTTTRTTMKRAAAYQASG